MVTGAAPAALSGSATITKVSGRNAEARLINVQRLPPSGCMRFPSDETRYHAKVNATKPWRPSLLPSAATAMPELFLNLLKFLLHRGRRVFKLVAGAIRARAS